MAFVLKAFNHTEHEDPIAKAKNLGGWRRTKELMLQGLVVAPLARVSDSRVFLMSATGKRRQVRVPHILQILVNTDRGRVVAVDRHPLQCDKEAAEL